MAAPALQAAKKVADSSGAEILTGEDLSRALAGRLIERVGLREAAEKIGIKPDALARFVAGARSHRGTVKLVEDGLKRGEKVKELTKAQQDALMSTSRHGGFYADPRTVRSLRDLGLATRDLFRPAQGQLTDAGIDRLPTDHQARIFRDERGLSKP
jgi:hypothetical protein